MAETFKYTGPISLFIQDNKKIGADSLKDYQPKLSFSPEDLETVPAELFAVKIITKSKNAERNGKTVFRYFAYQLSSDSKFSDLAPKDVTVQTPAEEIKRLVIETFKKAPDAVKRFNVNVPGQFATIAAADGNFQLFDFEESENGSVGYYLKPNTVATVEFTESEYMSNTYLRVRFSTELTSDEIFQKAGRAKRWGDDNSSVQSADVDELWG